MIKYVIVNFRGWENLKLLTMALSRNNKNGLTGWVTVKALLSPGGAYLLFAVLEGGLNREGGLLERGGLL